MIVILTLPLLFPLALLLLLKGIGALRTGDFQFYWAQYRGFTAVIAGLTAIVVSTTLLGFCGLLLGRAFGLK